MRLSSRKRWQNNEFLLALWSTAMEVRVALQHANCLTEVTLVHNSHHCTALIGCLLLHTRSNLKLIWKERPKPPNNKQRWSTIHKKRHLCLRGIWKMEDEWVGEAEIRKEEFLKVSEICNLSLCIENARTSDSFGYSARTSDSFECSARTSDSFGCSAKGTISVPTVSQRRALCETVWTLPLDWCA